MIELKTSNDKFSIWYFDGKNKNVPVLDEDEIKGKQFVFAMDEDKFNDDLFSEEVINETNEFFRKNNKVENAIVMKASSNFDFNLLLDMENAFYKNYDRIDDPKKLLLRTVDFYAANANDGTIMPYFEEYPLDYCFDINKKIEMFVDDIKKSDMSPFEKVLASYIICTHFMDSSLEYENSNSANIPVTLEDNVFGNSMHVLSDGKDGYRIKCSGYTDLFSRFLKKFDIISTPTLIYNADINLCHMISTVDLYDEKYDIDGRYICDLRTDSDFRRDVDEINRTITFKEDSNSYFTFMSLICFCNTVSDYESSLSYNNSLGYNKDKTKLTYSTIPGYTNVEEEVSTDRIDINKIGKALENVLTFVYSNSNNADSLDNRASAQALLESDRAISFFKIYREKVNQASSVNDTTIEKNKVG